MFLLQFPSFSFPPFPSFTSIQTYPKQKLDWGYIMVRNIGDENDLVAKSYLVIDTKMKYCLLLASFQFIIIASFLFFFFLCTWEIHRPLGGKGIKRKGKSHDRTQDL